MSLLVAIKSMTPSCAPKSILSLECAKTILSVLSWTWSMSHGAHRHWAQLPHAALHFELHEDDVAERKALPDRVHRLRLMPVCSVFHTQSRATSPCSLRRPLCR